MARAKPTLVFTDRYKATGTPYPNPKTMCRTCEGMKFYPKPCGCGGMKKGHKQQSEPMTDWCWVKPCDVCGGTGKKPARA